MLAASLILTRCQDSERASGGAELSAGPVTMTAAANPGSGFDMTIRSVVEALQREEIVVVPLPVQNRPGSSGADFFATMVERYRGRGRPGGRHVLVDDDQRAARQIKYGIRRHHDRPPDDGVLRRGHSRSLAVQEPRRSDDGHQGRPGSVTVGAASDDQAPFDLLVSAAGGDPASVDYVALEGGGDQISALVNSDISVAIGGVSEFVSLG